MKTERLLLRNATQDDFDAFHSIFTDARAMRYWDGPPHTTTDQTQWFLNAFMNNTFAMREEYVLEYKGRCIGKAGLWRKYEAGYIIHPDFWGMGMVVEAMRAIVPLAFQKFPETNVISAKIDPRNHASIRVLEKLGFHQTALVEKNHDYGGIEWCDTAYFRLMRSEV